MWSSDPFLYILLGTGLFSVCVGFLFSYYNSREFSENKLIYINGVYFDKIRSMFISKDKKLYAVIINGVRLEVLFDTEEAALNHLKAILKEYNITIG